MPVNKDNCLKLADFLENKITDEQFNMDTWMSFIDNNRPHCGTCGCIAGWAVTLQKEELWGKFIKDEMAKNGKRKHIGMKGIVTNEKFDQPRHFENRFIYEVVQEPMLEGGLIHNGAQSAASEWLGLNCDQADDLFHDSSLSRLDAVEELKNLAYDC